MDPISEQVKESAKGEKRQYVIFVGDIQEKWEQAQVLAKEIIREAGVKEPEKFVLEALDKRNGTPVAEFEPGNSVDLSEKDRKFFRVTPGGGGRS